MSLTSTSSVRLTECLLVSPESSKTFVVSKLTSLVVTYTKYSSSHEVTSQYPQKIFVWTKQETIITNC